MTVLRKLIIGIILLTGVLPLTVYSQNLGIGARLGEPTGLSAKMWSQPGNSMNFAAAWDLDGHSSLVLQADYVFYNYNLLDITIEEGTLPVYYGLGGEVQLANEGRVAIRVPVGVTFKFSEHPIDFFFELAPALNVYPETGFTLHGGIGAHYYF